MRVKERYDYLRSYRSNYVDVARRCAQVTLPYLIKEEEYRSKSNFENISTPWQSVGAKGVVTLASKLMLALLPPGTSFFKFILDDNKLREELKKEGVEEELEQIRSETELSLAKTERDIMDEISASTDRVIIHQALKHLIVAGNVLMYMGPKGMKMYPLNRYVVDRDGNGNVLEIITKEYISKRHLQKQLPQLRDKKPNSVGDPGGMNQEDPDEVEVYTRVYLKDGKHYWYQEIADKVINKSRGSAPVSQSPWIALRMNVVDGEPYGRGRVEEFLGDLNSLEALMQALVEGAAGASKLFYLVDPSSPLKERRLSEAKNGSVLTGRAEDVTVVQTNKALDFRTAQELAAVLEKRISEAFLILNVRNSERTTAEEVRMTQMELDAQLGGNYSLLTVEFLTPYLNRKLAIAQRNGKVILHRSMAKPTIVTGINSIGRGQDAESLTTFLSVVQQTFGPQAVPQFIDVQEALKRFAASLGIDVINLIKQPEQIAQQRQEELNRAKDLELTKQTAAMASAPMNDPSKNPNILNETNANPNPSPESGIGASPGAAAGAQGQANPQQ